MAERRARWAERGWDNYKDVVPAPDAVATPTTTNSAAPAKANGLPVRVYGSHDEEAQA